MSSYDLFIGRRTAGETWTDAMAWHQGDDIVYDLWESLAARVVDPSVGRFVRFDDDDTVDLAESSTGILVSLGTDHASVSAPYWHSAAEARTVLARVHQLADFVAVETGLRVYDIQLRREVDDAQAIDDALARYLTATEQRPPVSIAWMAQAYRNQKRSRRGA